MTAPRRATPRPLVLACALGALGALLLVLGGVTGTVGLSVAGFGAGSLSLAAALYWRSELITSWRAAQRGPRP